MDPTNITTENEAESTPKIDHSKVFTANVQQSLEEYFRHLDGEQPNNFYQMVITEMEIPLLTSIMEYTRGNQSKTAEILGISRGTLRKKLALYKINY